MRTATAIGLLLAFLALAQWVFPSGVDGLVLGVLWLAAVSGLMATYDG